MALESESTGLSIPYITQNQIEVAEVFRGIDAPLSILGSRIEAHMQRAGTGWHYLSQLRRLWYLSHRRPAKAQASLRIRAVSPEPLLFARISIE